MANDEWDTEIASQSGHDAETPATRSRRSVFKRPDGQMYALSLGIAFEDLDSARCHMHIRRLFEITAWIFAEVDGAQGFIGRFSFYRKYANGRGVGGDRQCGRHPVEDC